MSTSATSSISSMLNSRTRISGLSSNLDYESIIEKLMKVETAKVDRVKQQRTYLEWQKDGYRSFTTALTALKNKYFNVTSSSNLFSKTAFSRTKTSVADTSVLTASGTSTAGEATHSITVSQVATVGSAVGSSFLTSRTNVSVTDPATTAMSAIMGDTTAGSNILTIGNRSFTYDANQSVQSFINDVNSGNSNYTLSYVSGTGFKFEAKQLTTAPDPVTYATPINISGSFLTKTNMDINTSTDSVLSFCGSNLTDTLLTVDGKAYTAASTTETIDQFLAKVNSSNSSYTFSYDSNLRRFVASTKNTGADLGSASGVFIDKTGLKKDVTGTKLATEGSQNAKFSIDGVEYESTSNTYTLNGITYNFLKAGTTNCVSSRDIDGIVKNIQDFVTDYNKIIADINTKTNEQKDSDYPPLTDDQKSAMKDADITTWETKAKTGILENDDLLTGLGDKLKEAMYSMYNLSSKYNQADGTTTKMSLNEIGIGTTSRYDMGVLTVNETKLREALTEDPDKVADLFAREYYDSSDLKHSMYDVNGDNGTREKNSGVLTKVFDILSDYVRTNIDSHGQKGYMLERAGALNDTTDTDNYISDLIQEKSDEITELAKKLSEKEDYYYSKFTAMETAISNMNSQSSFLSSLSSK